MSPKAPEGEDSTLNEEVKKIIGYLKIEQDSLARKKLTEIAAEDKENWQAATMLGLMKVFQPAVTQSGVGAAHKFFLQVVNAAKDEEITLNN
ncbi:MAG: hypothetical protein Q4C70_13770, partial [Planctomycetia bacterium]|nr:hypothetical protein [Planctomycetia bacterium]